MRLITAKDHDDLAAKAFDLVEAVLADRPEPRVVLPTGNTPLGLYAACVKAGRTCRMAQGRFVQLDEYCDIAADDPRSLAGWVERVLLGPLGIGRDRLVAFDSATRDPDAEAARVERAVATMGLDLALLGLGPNGHLGFNEPGSDFASKTRHVVLTPESIKSNSVYWGGEDRVPRTAFTLGLGTLASARHSILLVAGEHKADILRRMLDEPPTIEVPATQLYQHASTTIIADAAALSKLTAGRIAVLTNAST